VFWKEWQKDTGLNRNIIMVSEAIERLSKQILGEGKAKTL
jgi:hypothetical protein